jgi:hypothetical protein
VEEQINMHLSQLQTWKRVFLMLLFAVVLTLIRWLAWVVILLQLFCVLITGRRNSNILSFGRSTLILRFPYHAVFNILYRYSAFSFLCLAYGIRINCA